MFANIDLAIMFLFGIMAILVLILTLVSINHVKSILLRTVIVILFASFLPIGYSSLTELLGRPKPISLMWIKNHIISDVGELDAIVLAYTLAEDEGIYLYLRLPDTKEPLSMVLPWNKKLAKKLKEGMKRTGATGTKLKMRIPFNNSLDQYENLFYEPPQPMMPPKPVPAGPRYFNPQSDPNSSGPNR